MKRQLYSFVAGESLGCDVACRWSRWQVAHEFGAQRILAGHGLTLFAGLSKRVDLKLVSRLEFGSGAVTMRYVPIR